MAACIPVAWTLSGVIGSQLGDVQDIINVQGQNIPVNQYVSETYGFDKDSLWYTVLVLLGFSIVFWFVVAGGLSTQLIFCIVMFS